MRRIYPVICVAGLLFAGCRPRVHLPPDRLPILSPPNPPRISPGEDQSEPGQSLIAKIPVVRDPSPVKADVMDPKTPEERLKSEVTDAFFAYDRSDLLPDARGALKQDALALKSILQDFPGIVLTVAGHCDERGSAEYNLALGDLRARAARDFLVELGVAEGQLEVISYGKERPQCEEPEPSCWQKNRRAHITKK